MTQAPLIGLTGKKGSGKSTVAEFLESSSDYLSLAFASTLKEYAYETDPWITAPSGSQTRLATLVDAFGWDAVKWEYPEARKYLQGLGSAVREFDPDFWIRPVMDVVELERGGYPSLPVVIQDVRYRNEAEAIHDVDGIVVRVVGRGEGGDSHASEMEQDRIVVDFTIHNDGDKHHLRQEVEALAAFALDPEVHP